VNWGALLATFALVIPAELPDKTFISCVVMSSRYRPGPVWTGAAAALVLQAGIAVAAGHFLALLPKTPLHAVVAALFILGAAFLIFVPEKKEEEKGERAAAGEPEPPGSTGWWKPALTTFGILALAEFGDLTQILIANLTARFNATWPVFIGASLAFILVSGLAVVSGRVILRVVPLQVVRRISGAALLGMGIYTLTGLL
jgi:putative Ca2+/H+ antiporter (TMEM165/GDT1 family)